MAFDVEKLFVDVFRPQSGEVATIVFDSPNDDFPDNAEWLARREMVQRWHASINSFAQKLGITVNPLLSYSATGAHNRDLPKDGEMDGKPVQLDDVFSTTTIFIAMTEYSASAPLIVLAKKYDKLRGASMPGVTAAMEQSGLSADYAQIATVCEKLEPLFERAIGVEVSFSTKHSCYFDISDNNTVFMDNGILDPSAEKPSDRLCNLPSGEVCVVPNEQPGSKTAGEIPVGIDGEVAVFVIKENQVVDVKGFGPEVKNARDAFAGEVARRNIAEVAIGCNDKAAVTGNVLEDEKAGFHFAYGRSDHLDGTIGVDNFSSPEKVVHQDIVYAKGSPVVCKRLDFVFADGSKKTVIVDGILDV